MNDKLLRIYLNDHLAGATAGYELARRCESNNRESELGAYLRDFLRELEEDIAQLRRVLDLVGGTEDRLKQATAWAAEKVGRLKLNGQLTGYSDLSRMLEVEGLRLGVEGKLSLWRSLRHVAGADTRLQGVDFETLIERAKRQVEALEMHRLSAAARAFAQ